MPPAKRVPFVVFRPGVSLPTGLCDSVRPDVVLATNWLSPVARTGHGHSLALRARFTVSVSTRQRFADGISIRAGSALRKRWRWPPGSLRQIVASHVIATAFSSAPTPDLHPPNGREPPCSHVLSAHRHSLSPVAGTSSDGAHDAPAPAIGAKSKKSLTQPICCVLFAL